MANPDMTDCDGFLDDISVSMRQLPYPQYIIDVFLTIIATILPLFVILAYIYSAGVFTKVCLSHCLLLRLFVLSLFVIWFALCECVCIVHA